MKTVIYLIIACTLCSQVASAQQSPPVADREAIRSMCGCYSITFDYAETFATDTGYTLKKPYHASAAAEWIFVEEETDDRIVIQHLLLINDTMVIKHWRQDWLFENTALYQYHKDRQWNFVRLPENEVRGQWTQKVYQVDDGPRYEGSATWVHVDGRHSWENTSDAPLPRREFTKRDDYNVLKRTNRHILTDNGWLHEQDNLKIVRSEAGDKVLVAEKGLNEYKRIDDSHCQAAMTWWKQNQHYWKLVRSEWDKIYAQGKDIQTIKKADDKLLWQALFELGDASADKASTEPEAVSKAISETLHRYLVFSTSSN